MSDRIRLLWTAHCCKVEAENTMAKLTPQLFTKGVALAHCSAHPVKEADYLVYEVDGEPMLHIRTYSSTARKQEGKACQHIQIDREMAQVLVSIMKEAGLID